MQVKRLNQMANCHSIFQHTLTGHSAKVMAGKFLGETKAVTGSYDRTLKIWDLRTHGCTETKFAGSSCNDLVTTDGSGMTFISAHFDKKVRFWDTRSESSFSERELQGKVTSLDLSKDCKYLLCCVRNDTIQMLDLRNSKDVLRSFSHEDFKVACDWTRVAFSFDAATVAAGSADGSIFLWHSTGLLATVLKEHSSAVVAVDWHPVSSVLASVHRSKKCMIWVD